MATHTIPPWITQSDLIWRPATVEYPLAWEDLLVLKGNSWLDTYKEGNHTYVRRNTTRLVPVIQRTLGQRGLDELRQIENKGSFDDVTHWVVGVYQAAAYAHFAHVPNLATAERDRPRSAKSVFKKMLDLDSSEKRELSEIWFDSITWEFGKWREHVIDIANDHGGPDEYRYSFLYGLVQGYCAIGFGPEEGVRHSDSVNELGDLLLRAWLDARRKWLSHSVFYGFLARAQLLYFDGVPEYDPILEIDL